MYECGNASSGCPPAGFPHQLQKVQDLHDDAMAGQQTMNARHMPETL